MTYTTPGGKGHTTDVVVVGAGPVGCCLALDLAWRGVEVVLVDERAAEELPSVKCNHVAARTMEVFRRLGFADAIRDLGLPAQYPHDIAFRTTTTGREFGRILIPGRAGRASGAEGADSNWPTPEPAHRVNQIYLEPALREQVAACEGVAMRSLTRAIQASEDAAGVNCVVEDLSNGSRETITARFLVGCDGARSAVRHWVGASLQGDAVVQRTQSTYIDAPDLLSRMQGAPAWGTFSLNHERSGMVYAIDGRERWLVHNYLIGEDEQFDTVDREASIRAILGVGADFAYEVISQEDWVGRRLVANRFRNRSMFICGDAAHLWVPYAGFGMNAGIADAVDLAWLLAAVIAGWAGPRALDAYEAERLPITEQVSHFAMNHAFAVAKERRAVPAAIDDDGPEGDRARAEFGARCVELNTEQYAAAGLNFGYFYDKSPIISYDDGVAPEYTMGEFTPSTVPGCRAPHVWLADGRSLWDALGVGFTVVCDALADAAPLLAEAERLGIPMSALSLDGSSDSKLYDHAFVLIRPDQHVAWRADQLPEDVAALLGTVTGRS